MFERTKDRYVTRGIMEQVPMELQMFSWHVLEQGQSHHGMDCLQVFKPQIDEEQNLHAHHSQERPGCQKTYSLAGVGADMPASHSWLIPFYYNFPVCAYNYFANAVHNFAEGNALATGRQKLVK